MEIERTKSCSEAVTTSFVVSDSDILNLVENLPGAIFTCLYDESITLLQMSDSFLSLYGYSRDEVKTLFNNSFIEMIYPADRARVLREVKEQLSHTNEKTIEYRIMTKGGELLWVIDKGRLVYNQKGEQMFYCILLDVSATHLAQEELRISLERHRIILDQTTDVIFEWDIANDFFLFSDNWKKKFGYEPLTKDITKNLATSSHLHPDDVPHFLNMLQEVKRGVPYAETVVRIEKNAALYIWCRIRITAQADRNGTSYKAVGVIVDIDTEKKQSQRLTEKAERDTLTKLYNKGTSQALITDYLLHGDSQKYSAMLMIDIDDFKLINDTMGHLLGDAFLMEVTNEINNLFRSCDIVGRIGGDEFTVFMKDIQDVKIAQTKAQQIIDVFARLPIQEKLSHRVSCSVGIAAYPSDGTDFLTLYKNADMALYQAKKQGKNQFVTFTSTLDPFHPCDDVCSTNSVVNEQIDSDQDITTSLANRLVEYAFRALYQSIDTDSAINGVLDIVGRQLDVSRVYIFDSIENNTYCRNTFEWCNDDILPEIDNLQHIPYLDGTARYTDNFNENGIFYCRDITTLPVEQQMLLEAQGVKSVLQCAFIEHGEIKGFLGFDECRTNRFWTKEQIGTLTFIAEILSTFLLKKRANIEKMQTAQSLQHILDNQNSWIYVIDTNTMKMHFINQKVKDLLPNINAGMCCHKAFFNRDTPCEICPARNVDATHKDCTLEVYNPLLNLWTSADASFLNWEGKDACILTCHDITKYKTPQ